MKFVEISKGVTVNTESISVIESGPGNTTAIRMKDNSMKISPMPYNKVVDMVSEKEMETPREEKKEQVFPWQPTP